MVYAATRYHKGYAISGDVKIIHQYLPSEVGELVVWYLWLVLPFQQRLEAMVWEKEAISSHMWPADPNGRKWTSERFREALKRRDCIVPRNRHRHQPEIFAQVHRVYSRGGRRERRVE
jgi:hypothetical protein